MTLGTTMEFTKDELLLMNEGVSKLIQDASKATDFVSYDEAQKHIWIHIEELQELSKKLSKGAENARTFL